MQLNKETKPNQTNVIYWSLIGRVCLWILKQDRHLCLKIYKSLWKCLINSEGRVYRSPKKYMTRELFNLWQSAESASFGECERGPRYFLKCRVACGLRPCAQTHLKKVLCHTHPVGGPEDKSQMKAESAINCEQVSSCGILICICMQNHNDDTIKTSDTVS